MVGMYLIIWQLCEAGQENQLLIKFYQCDKYWPFHSKSASSPSTTTELTVNFRASYRGSFQKSFLKDDTSLQIEDHYNLYVFEKSTGLAF